MLSFSCIPVGSLITNCYIVWDDNSLECVVIDPGDSGDTINQFLLDKQLTPIAVLATHGHFDHLLGVLEVVTAWNIPFRIHSLDAPLAKKATASAVYHLGRQVDPIPLPSSFFHDQEIIPLGSEKLTVWHTPGHTPGSVCFIHEAIAFTGDTVFSDGSVGRTDFSYSNNTHLQTSLKKLHLLPKKTLILAGHGALSPQHSTTLGTQPF